MTTPQITASDPNLNLGVAQYQTNQTSGWDTFATILGGTLPGINESLIYSGQTATAAAVSAAGNAAWVGANNLTGGGTTAMYSMGGSTYPMTGSIGGTSIGAYTGASTATSYGAPTGGTGTISGDVGSLVSDGATQQAELIELQFMISQQSNYFAATSNALRSKQDGEMNMIRNFRG